jgi:hypothetical protein
MELGSVFSGLAFERRAFAATSEVDTLRFVILS